MKQFVCELCGSHKVIKKDGYFICEECGTKYSLEEAKNLIKDVEEDKKPSDMLKALKDLTNQESSKQEDVASTVNKYDQEALKEFEEALKDTKGKDIKRLGHQLYLQDKSNPYFAVCESIAVSTEGSNGEMGNSALKLADDINKAFDMELKSTNNKSEIIDFSMFVAKNLRNDLFYQRNCLKYYDSKVQLSDSDKRPFLKCFALCPFNIAKYYEANVLPKVAEGKDAMLIIAKQSFEILQEFDFSYNSLDDYVLPILEFIKKYQPDFTHPIATRVLQRKESVDKKGCYVATCIYGSYDCPEVWRLRRYRDDYLDSHWWGRAFIKVYYATSPTLVKWFGKKEWFRKPVTKMLERKLKKCKNMGYEDTPYDDKY